MTLIVCAAVLVAALLHASWNAMLKGGRDLLLDTAGIVAGAALLGLPLAIAAPVPAQASWPYIGGSVAIHCAYYALIVAAYRAGDLSLVYPLMRGAAPLVTGLGALLLLGERPSPIGWAGMALTCGGVLVLGWRTGAHASRRAVVFALANAAVIASYTLVDGTGARLAGDADAVRGYIGWLFVLNGVPVTIFVLARRGAALPRSVAATRGRALVGATASMASYGIVIWAMTRAPLALVAALRETSVLFAAFLGARLLRERLTRRRWLGAAAVVLGAVALKIG